MQIDFEKQGGLVPVIAQDEQSGEVLMLAYMNEEALELTRKSNYAHYYSRSKKRIWMKGESSGHTQEVKAILADCDSDTILLKVAQKGQACHTGRFSCFFQDMQTNQETKGADINPNDIYDAFDVLFNTIKDRKSASPESSWTAKLFSKGENTILKKVVEEAGEFAFALKDNDKHEMIYEASDLIYHLFVALAFKNISIDEVRAELKRRFGVSGIEEKNSR